MLFSSIYCHLVYIYFFKSDSLEFNIIWYQNVPFMPPFCGSSFYLDPFLPPESPKIRIFWDLLRFSHSFKLLSLLHLTQHFVTPIPHISFFLCDLLKENKETVPSFSSSLQHIMCCSYLRPLA